MIIRSMCATDINTIAVDYCPPWSTVQETKERWNKYAQEQQDGIRRVGVIEQADKILGYGSLLLQSEYSRFSSIPEIADVWIYEEYRGKGIGSRLIAWLEELAREKGYKQIGIGVGLYEDYGAAQKLYFHLGYCPDGYGITHKCQPTTPGESYPVDDDLILWLKKDLS